MKKEMQKQRYISILSFLTITMLLSANCTRDHILRLEPLAGIRLEMQDQAKTGLPEYFDAKVEVFINDELNKTLQVHFQFKNGTYHAAKLMEIPLHTDVKIRVTVNPDGNNWTGESETFNIAEEDAPYLITITLVTNGGSYDCYIKGPDGYTYMLTSNEYDVLEDDLSQAVINEFGAGAMIADWNDLQTHFSGNISSFLNEICVYPDSDLGVTSATVLRNGNGFHSGDRHYFMRRFDGDVADGWAVHDHIDNYTLCLGSWWGARRILVKYPAKK